MLQTKEQDTTPGEKIPNEKEINYLPDKEFIAMVIRMHTKLRRKMEGYRRTSNNVNHPVRTTKRIK